MGLPGRKIVLAIAEGTRGRVKRGGDWEYGVLEEK
jgi:hypothetical protein